MEFVGFREIVITQTSTDGPSSITIPLEVDSGHVLKILNVLETYFASYSSNTIKLDGYNIYKSSNSNISYSTNFPLFVSEGTHELSYSCWDTQNRSAKLICQEFKLTPP